ncbi:MAG: DUF433 domain-containing protein [Acidobacteria bacterium]|nr:DUF433 domain-containing protein [Acidobacteriota bacterium]
MASKPAAPDIYGGHDPADLPAYPIREVAHFLWIPAGKIRRWAQGYRMAGIEYSPVIEIADPERGRLSFNNLAELHILGALRDEQISLQKLRQAIAYLRRRVLDHRHPHPLLAVDLQTDGLSLFIKHLGQLLNITREGQLAIKEVFEAHLRRIERDPAKMTALRFYPYVRPVRTGERAGLEQPCPVAIDPRVSFGRPVLAGTGIPTSELAERFSAGDGAPGMNRPR